jgi:hypothetical protein
MQRCQIVVLHIVPVLARGEGREGGKGVGRDEDEKMGKSILKAALRV